MRFKKALLYSLHVIEVNVVDVDVVDVDVVEVDVVESFPVFPPCILEL